MVQNTIRNWLSITNVNLNKTLEQLLVSVPKNVWALDVETSPKNPKAPVTEALIPELCQLDLICITSNEEALIFTKIEELNKWLEKNPDAKFVGHYNKFDFRVCRAKGAYLDKRRFHGCTMLMAHAYKEKVSETYLDWYDQERKRLNSEGAKHRDAGYLSLKVLAPYFLGIDPFWEVHTYNDTNYVFKDTFYTLLLYTFFLEQMSPQEMEFYTQKSLNWTWALLENEERGIRLSRNRLVELKEELIIKEQKLLKTIDAQWAEANKEWRKIEIDKVTSKYKAMKYNKSWQKRFDNALSKVPTKMNLDSPTQIKWLFRDYLGLDITTFEGDESTGREVLEQLIKDGREDVKNFLDYRKTGKLLTGFIPTYEYLTKDTEIIHAGFSSTGTRTGRLSSSQPNLQQVSKELKHLFIPREGYKFICLDLAAIEAQLIAWYSDDEALCNILNNNYSIHDFNAKVFFDLECPITQVAKEFPRERKAAKTVGFALFYGAGPKRIQAAFTAAGFPTSEAQAKRVHENFKRTYHGAHTFHREITKTFEDGETVLNALGRPIRIQGHENPYMQGFNTLVQSSASDINLDAAYKSGLQWKAEGIDAQVLLLIHDAIVAEVRADQAEKAFNILKSNMERFKLKTKFGTFTTKAEGGITDEWE